MDNVLTLCARDNNFGFAWNGVFTPTNERVFNTILGMLVDFRGVEDNNILPEGHIITSGAVPKGPTVTVAYCDHLGQDEDGYDLYGGYKIHIWR